MANIFRIEPENSLSLFELQITEWSWCDVRKNSQFLLNASSDRCDTMSQHVTVLYILTFLFASRNLRRTRQIFIAINPRIVKQTRLLAMAKYHIYKHVQSGSKVSFHVVRLARYESL